MELSSQLPAVQKGLWPSHFDRFGPAIFITVAFAALFHQPLIGLAQDWWLLPEAGHGLLLVPIAIWLAWRGGRHAAAGPQMRLGAAVLVLAVVLRYAAGLAAEHYTMRASVLGALIGLTVYFGGLRQVLHWWLPFTLAFLAIPLPEIVTQALSLPLQFKASQMGAALLEMRNVPVIVTGNVIRLPGQELFVTEACSGLRSLTALISTAILLSAMLLRTLPARLVLVLLSIPIAILINGVRVFLTGFLVYFVSPSAGTGFMHVTEGWLLFLVSLAALGACSVAGAWAERWYGRRRSHA